MQASRARKRVLTSYELKPAAGGTGHMATHPYQTPVFALSERPAAVVEN